MRQIYRNIRKMAMAALVLPLVAAFSACSNDDDMPALTFSETQLLNCTAGETLQLEFDAQADWKVSASQIWCKFVQDGQVVRYATGKTGKQSLTLQIDDEGLTQSAGKPAILTLYMQGQSGVLAELARSAAGYELQVFDAEGHPVQEITVGFDSYATIQVEANFAFAATSFPDWVELQGGSLTGAANRKAVGGVRVVPNGTVEKTEQEGVLLFQDLKGQASFQIKLVYAGMDRDTILINQPELNAFYWKVSADGQTWTYGASTYERFIKCGISAYHDDYEMVYVEEDADGRLSIGCDWLHFNKALGRLSADATESTRQAYALAFPRAVYASMQDNLAAALVETEDGKEQLKRRYEQNNLVVHVTQEVAMGGDDDADVGFIALCFDENWEMMWIRCNRVTDTAMLDRVEELTGCRELFLLDTPSPRGHFDQVRPWPLISDYDGLSGESAYFMDKDGQRMEDETPELSFSDSETPSYWYIMGCRNTTDPMYLVLLDADGKNVTKVLLIDTNGK